MSFRLRSATEVKMPRVADGRGPAWDPERQFAVFRDRRVVLYLSTSR
jgi:hypothetical protein